jgi:hypothetical protein
VVQALTGAIGEDLGSLPCRWSRLQQTTAQATSTNAK